MDNVIDFQATVDGARVFHTDTHTQDTAPWLHPPALLLDFLFLTFCAQVCQLSLDVCICMSGFTVGMFSC